MHGAAQKLRAARSCALAIIMSLTSLRIQKNSGMANEGGRIYAVARTMLAALVIFASIYTPPASSERHGPIATCEGLDNMIASSTELTCTRNADCDSAHCTLTQAVETTLSVTLLSCRNPPGVHVSFGGGRYITRDEILDDVESLEIGDDSVLSVIVEQLEDQDAIGFAAALTVEASRTREQDTITLFRYSVLPLETESCPDQEPTEQQDTPDETPTDMSGPRHGTRMSGPRGGSRESGSRGGSRESGPRGGSRESGSRPGGTRMTSEMGNNGGTDGGTMSSQEVTTSTPVTPPTTITPTTSSTTTVQTITTTSIPEDSTEIPSTATLLTVNITSPTTSSPPMDADKTMCEVLEEVSKSSGCVAKTQKPCDRVQCFDVYEGIEYDAVLLLCKEPAALHVSLRRGNRDLVSMEVDRSQEIEIPEPFGAIVSITLDHFPNDVIGLQVEASIGVSESDPVLVIEYVKIPLDKSDCNSNSNSISDDVEVGIKVTGSGGVTETTPTIPSLIISVMASLSVAKHMTIVIP